MGITLIPNQPVRFKNTALPEECVCMGQDFAQLINKNDQTQYQVKSSNQVTNGEFANNLDNWNVYLGISGTVIITNESAIDECDGSVEITAIGGTPGYTYSIDGITFQASNEFDNLCIGHYTVTIKDSTGKQGSVEFDIATNVDCGTVGCIESDLFPYDETSLFNCDETSFFCQYEVEITDEDVVTIIGQSNASLFPDGKKVAILDGGYIGVYEVVTASNSGGDTNIILGGAFFHPLDFGSTLTIAR